MLSLLLQIVFELHNYGISATNSRNLQAFNASITTGTSNKEMQLHKSKKRTNSSKHHLFPPPTIYKTESQVFRLSIQF